MQFSADCYDADTIALMTRAFDAAWKEAEHALANGPIDPISVRRMMSLRIMAAVCDGERDPEHLAKKALDGIANVQ